MQFWGVVAEPPGPRRAPHGVLRSVKKCYHHIYFGFRVALRGNSYYIQRGGLDISEIWLKRDSSVHPPSTLRRMNKYLDRATRTFFFPSYKSEWRVKPHPVQDDQVMTIDRAEQLHKFTFTIELKKMWNEYEELVPEYKHFQFMASSSYLAPQPSDDVMLDITAMKNE